MGANPPRIVVTGGTRGIGAAVARRCAAAGSQVVAMGRTHREPSAPGVQVELADVADPEALDAAFARADGDGAGLTGLVVAAGVWEPTAIDGSPCEVSSAHARVLSVNVLGCVHSVASFLRRLRGGSSASIVLVGSTAGQRGEAGHGAYAASKSALLGFCKSWAVDLAPRGVRVNVVAPGWVDTDMTASALGDASRRSAIEAAIPRGRVATAGDVAGPVVFLLGDDAVHVTGTVLSVNGGGVMASF